MALELLDIETQTTLTERTTELLRATIIENNIPDVDLIADRVTGSTFQKSFAAVMTALPLAKFKGEAMRIRPTDATKVITPTYYQGGITITKRELMYDKTLDNVINNKIPGMLNVVKKKIANAIYSKFTTIQSDTGFIDGAAIASASHSWPASPNDDTYSNLGSAALVDTALYAAEAAMMRFLDPVEDPINTAPNVIMVPPELKGTAEGIVNPQHISTGGDNLLYNQYKIIVNPYLSDENDWILMDIHTAKPLVYYIPDTAQNSVNTPNPRVELTNDTETDSYHLDVYVDFAVEWTGAWWTVYYEAVS